MWAPGGNNERFSAERMALRSAWVDLRATAGAVEPSHVLLYYLFKSFAPGSPNEKDGLLRKVLNPNVCTQPQAAQLELMRWRSDVLRLKALGCMPPDLPSSCDVVLILAILSSMLSQSFVGYFAAAAVRDPFGPVLRSGRCE